jgi:phage major head subunit gpT-like protein
MIITQANLQIFFTATETRFWTAYKLAEARYQKIATIYPVATEVWLSGFLTMIQKYREWIGARVNQTPAPLTYAVPIKNWENTQVIDKFRFEDDTYGIYAPTVPFMGMQAAKLPDYQIRDLILNQGSWTGTFQNCLDGLTFFNTAHPVNYWDPSQGTYTNDYTSGGTTVNNQLIGGGLNMTAFSTVWEDMTRRKNESGEAWGLIPNMAMTGPILKLAMDTLLQAQFIGAPVIGQLGTGTGANAPMVGATSNQMRAWADYFMWEDLSSSTAIGTGSNTYDQVWYLLCTSGPVKPFAWLMRKAPDFTYRINPQDPVVFEKHQYQYGSEARGSAAFGFPQLASRSGP